MKLFIGLIVLLGLVATGLGEKCIKGKEICVIMCPFKSETGTVQKLYK